MAELPRGPRGFVLCRYCGTECDSARKTFCKPECVHEWRIRSNAGYAAQQVEKRDHGICAKCMCDCNVLRRRVAYARGEERERLIAKWSIPRHLLRGRRFWEMNHIVPVIEGGGTCGLANLETLCWACHARHTKSLAGRRATERKSDRQLEMFE